MPRRDVLGYRLPPLPWLGWVSPLLGSVIFAWRGRPFLAGAVDEVKARKPGMMLLISLAISVAFLASWSRTRPGAGGRPQRRRAASMRISAASRAERAASALPEIAAVV